jgi:MoaA/NifB/PqqE/SkfB family radical SAM enzyme
MCDIWKRQESTSITAADLERHRDSLRRLSVEWVVLSGGEPLMHSNLGDLCTFFREMNIRLTLLTTGLLLARRAAAVAALFDDVIISLDGPPEIHDAIRRVKGSFNLIRSGIATVREIRPVMRITARTTVQKANYPYLQETILSAKSAGLDGISFLAADLTSEAFNRAVAWPSERQSQVALSEEEVAVLEGEVEAIIARFAADLDDGYIAENADKLRKIVTHFKAHLAQATYRSPMCNAPWVSAVIEANGDVRPCFFHRVLGNIRDSSLQEIINGEDAQIFRRDLNVAKNPVCQRCVCALYRPDAHRSEPRLLLDSTEKIQDG